MSFGQLLVHSSDYSIARWVADSLVRSINRPICHYINRFELLLKTVKVVRKMRRVAMAMSITVFTGSFFGFFLMRVAAHLISHLQAKPLELWLE